MPLPLSQYRKGLIDPNFSIRSRKIKKDKEYNLLYLDGLTDYIDCGSDASLNIAGVLKIETLINIHSTTGNWERIIQKADLSGFGFSLRTQNNKFHFQAKQSDNLYNAISTNQFNYNNWYYLKGINDTINPVKLYINNILQTGHVYDIAGDGGGDDLEIGRRVNEIGISQSNMSIKYLKINDETIINLIMKSKSSSKKIIKDKSGNNNNGILNGCTWRY
ncbi:hypothetical protein KAU33_14255 [Candidatus Dependentiae bacterium]|nr:hypothetical protein [Candidatus Dependentiae bacterium]